MIYDTEKFRRQADKVKAQNHKEVLRLAEMAKELAAYCALLGLEYVSDAKTGRGFVNDFDGTRIITGTHEYILRELIGGVHNSALDAVEPPPIRVTLA